MISRSRTEYAIINIMVGFVGYFLNTIMGFICRMVFVRCLAVEYLGISGLFSNILSMLSLAELGIGTAIVYALYKPIAENDKEKIASLMQFYCKVYRVIGCIVAIIGLSLVPFLSFLLGDVPDIKENIYLIYVIYLFNTCLTYFFSYRASLLTAAQRNYIQLGLSYIISTIQSIVQIVVLLVSHEYILYLIIQTIGVFLFNVIISWKATRDYPFIKNNDVKQLDKNEKKSLFKNVKALAVNKISELLVNSTDNIIITYFSGLITVGAASNYTLLSGTVSTLTNQIFNSMIASVGNLNAIENKEKSYDFYKILQLFNFIVFGWATIGICFLSSDLVALFFGQEFVMNPSIPFVLALNFYLVTIQSAIRTYRTTLGLFKYGQYTLIFTAVFNLLFSVWLGKIWGLFGIYIATSFARILTNVWYIPYAVYKFGFQKKPIEYFTIYFKYLMIILIDGGICYFLCSLINFNLVITIIVKILICSIVPNFTVLVFCGRKAEFKYVKNKFCELFKKVVVRHIKENS